MRISIIYRFLWILWLLCWLVIFSHHHHFAIPLIAVTPVVAVFNQLVYARFENKEK